METKPFLSLGKFVCVLVWTQFWLFIDKQCAINVSSRWHSDPPPLIFFDSASCQTCMEHVWSCGRLLKDSVIVSTCVFVCLQRKFTLNLLLNPTTHPFRVRLTSRVRAVFLACAAIRPLSKVSPQNGEKVQNEINLSRFGARVWAQFQSDTAYKRVKDFPAPFTMCFMCI